MDFAQRVLDLALHRVRQPHHSCPPVHRCLRGLVDLNLRQSAIFQCLRSENLQRAGQAANFIAPPVIGHPHIGDTGRKAVHRGGDPAKRAGHATDRHHRGKKHGAQDASDRQARQPEQHLAPKCGEVGDQRSHFLRILRDEGDDGRVQGLAVAPVNLVVTDPVRRFRASFAHRAHHIVPQPDEIGNLTLHTVQRSRAIRWQTIFPGNCPG